MFLDKLTETPEEEEREKSHQEMRDKERCSPFKSFGDLYIYPLTVSLRRTTQSGGIRLKCISTFSPIIGGCRIYGL